MWDVIAGTASADDLVGEQLEIWRGMHRFDVAAWESIPSTQAFRRECRRLGLPDLTHAEIPPDVDLIEVTIELAGVPDCDGQPVTLAERLARLKEVYARALIRRGETGELTTNEGENQ